MTIAVDEQLWRPRRLGGVGGGGGGTGVGGGGVRVRGLQNMRMASALKTIVSKNKRRHVEDGFNLDLSYISDRIIAMGFPAENVESLYRNSLDEVKRFLEQKHAGHYFIYNLCSERYYDVKKFHGRVATYPFDDHHPPDFASIKPFCDDVSAWLEKDKKNVAAVHCKAGKGRTGVMICCFLLHIKRFATANDVLEFYGQQRTVDRKGVTIPSQRRYINYYSSIIRDRLVYSPVKLYLQELVIDPVPAFGMPGTNEFYLQFELRQSGKSDDKSFVSPEYLVRKGERQVRLEVNPPLLICGDVKIEFSSKTKLLDNFGNFGSHLKKSKIGYPKREFHFWFNTFFVDSPFSSELSHSVTEDHPAIKEMETAGNSSSHEGLIMRDSIDSSDSGRLLAAPSNGAATGGVYQNRGLRSYPAPERHASCAGGGTPSTDTGGMEEESAESLTNLMKSTSISHDHLLREKSAPLPQHQEAQLQPTPPQQQLGHRHQPVRHSQSHHLQHQHSHQGHPMATSTSSSSSSSSSSNANSGAASTTTLPSFSDIRKRHTSMPQTKLLPSAKHSSAVFEHRTATLLEPPSFSSSSTSSASNTPPFNVPGSPVCLRLDKCQVDKAFKDKTSKVFPANFHVHLFLLRPDDQSDAGKFSSSPVCVNKGSGDVCTSSGFREKQKHPSSHDSSSSSEEEDTTDSEALCGGGARVTTTREGGINVRQQQQQAFHSEWI